MPNRTFLLGVLAVAAAGLLSACASRQGAAPTTAAAAAAAAAAAPAPVPIPDPWAGALEGFEQHQREAATAAERQGQWLEAAWAWEVLLALNPRDADIARRLAEARAAATAAASERVARGHQAQQRGDTESAMRLFVEALALVPALPEAAEALRTIERERVRRQHLGQVSRYTLLRRPEPSNGSAANTQATPERNELEHATILANQGELEGAINVLKPLASGPQADAAAKKLLADLYVKRADSQAATDRAAAVESLERALAADPTHPRATMRLTLLRESAKKDAGATAPAPDERKTKPKTPEAAKSR